MATLLILPAPMWIGDIDAQLVAGDVAAALERFEGRLGYAFDATEEEAIVTPEMVMPTQYTGSGLTSIIHYATKSSTSQVCSWDIFVEAKTPNADTLDMETASSWDSVNAVDDTTLGTAGNPASISKALTNADSAVVGDTLRFGLRRDTDGNDVATGDLIFFCMEIADDR